jgi:hypothetical protein
MAKIVDQAIFRAELFIIRLLIRLLDGEIWIVIDDIAADEPCNNL